MAGRPALLLLLLLVVNGGGGACAVSGLQASVCCVESTVCGIKCVVQYSGKCTLCGINCAVQCSAVWSLQWAVCSAQYICSDICPYQLSRKIGP